MEFKEYDIIHVSPLAKDERGPARFIRGGVMEFMIDLNDRVITHYWPCAKYSWRRQGGFIEVLTNDTWSVVAAYLESRVVVIRVIDNMPEPVKVEVA